VTADHIINGILMLIGATIFYALYHYGILSGDVIWKILTAEV
jgi:hypothetical protein